MSSILKALKKLESESEVKVDIQPLAQQLDTKKVLKKRSEIFVLLQRMLVYLVAALVLITGGWVMFGHKYFIDDNGGEVSIGILPNAQNKLNKQENQPQKLDAGKPFQGSDQKAEIVLSQKEDDSEKKSTASLGRDLGVGDKTDQEKIFYSEEKSLEVVEKETEQSSTVPASPADIGNFRVNESIVIREEKSLKRLDDSSMRLQAITWSNKPEDRFVLIDNIIVREGESVNGYFIERILEDYVEVKKGSGQWRIDFRLR